METSWWAAIFNRTFRQNNWHHQQLHMFWIISCPPRRSVSWWILKYSIERRFLMNSKIFDWTPNIWRSIEYFRIHQETLRRGGQEIIQNIWSWWCQLFWWNFLLNIAAHQDVKIPPRSSIYFEELIVRKFGICCLGVACPCSVTSRIV